MSTFRNCQYSAVAIIPTTPTRTGNRGETPRHVKNLLQTFGTLELHFAPERTSTSPGTCSSTMCVATGAVTFRPDIFVCPRIPKTDGPERRSYRTWRRTAKAGRRH